MKSYNELLVRDRMLQWLSLGGPRPTSELLEQFGDNDGTLIELGFLNRRREVQGCLNGKVFNDGDFCIWTWPKEDFLQVVWTARLLAQGEERKKYEARAAELHEMVEKAEGELLEIQKACGVSEWNRPKWKRRMK